MSKPSSTLLLGAGASRTTPSAPGASLPTQKTNNDRVLHDMFLKTTWLLELGAVHRGATDIACARATHGWSGSDFVCETCSQTGGVLDICTRIDVPRHLVNTKRPELLHGCEIWPAMSRLRLPQLQLKRRAAHTGGRLDTER